MTSKMFTFDEQCQPFIKAQVMVSGLSLLFLPGFNKSSEFEVMELV